VIPPAQQELFPRPLRSLDYPLTFLVPGVILGFVAYEKNGPKVVKRKKG
jgi:hypothetical protein